MNLDQNALSEMLEISRLKLAIAEEGGDCENPALIDDESIRLVIDRLEDIQDAIGDVREALKLYVILTDEGQLRQEIAPHHPYNPMLFDAVYAALDELEWLRKENTRIVEELESVAKGDAA